MSWTLTKVSVLPSSTNVVPGGEDVWVHGVAPPAKPPTTTIGCTRCESVHVRVRSRGRRSCGVRPSVVSRGIEAGKGVARRCQRPSAVVDAPGEAARQDWTARRVNGQLARGERIDARAYKLLAPDPASYRVESWRGRRTISSESEAVSGPDPKSIVAPKFPCTKICPYESTARPGARHSAGLRPRRPSPRPCRDAASLTASSASRPERPTLEVHDHGGGVE